MTEDYTYTAPDPFVLDFDPPVKSKDGTLSRLELREPNATEVWIAEQYLAERNGSRAMRLYQRAMVAKVGSVPGDVLDEMPIGAFTKAARYLQSFVEAGLSRADAESDAAAESPTDLTIIFAEPVTVGTASHTSITVSEPTLAQMTKAETALGDMSAQRVRAYQQSLVAMASGESAGFVAALPISVLNRAASFVLGFSNAGRGIGA